MGLWAATVLWSAAGVTAAASPPAASESDAASESTQRSADGHRGQTELRRAIAAAQADRLDRALELSRSALEKDPTLERGYLLAGSLCGLKQDLACEAAFYDRGLKALPGSAELMTARALLHLQQGEYDRAVTLYERAIRIEEKADTLADLAYAYVYVDRLQDAHKLAQRAVRLDDTCFACWMALGQVELSRRAFPTSLQAFQRARALRPDDPDASRQVAKALFLTGQRGRASALYESLVAASPSDLRLRLQAARVAIETERFDDATKHLRAAQAAQPEQDRLLKLLAKAQREAGAKAPVRKASE